MYGVRNFVWKHVIQCPNESRFMNKNIFALYWCNSDTYVISFKTLSEQKLAHGRWKKKTIKRMYLEEKTRTRQRLQAA